MGLVKALLLRPNTTIIATYHNVTPESHRALPCHETSELISLKMKLDSFGAVEEAVTELFNTHEIEHVDVLIANAGMTTTMLAIQEATEEEIAQCMEVNFYGFLRTIENLLPPLIEANVKTNYEKESKLVYISSSCGSIGGMEPVPCLAYGVSKAAANYLVKHVDTQWGDDLLAFSLHPGWVDTEMGNSAANDWSRDTGGMRPPLSVEESVRKMLDVVSSHLLLLDARRSCASPPRDRNTDVDDRSIILRRNPPVESSCRTMGACCIGRIEPNSLGIFGGYGRHQTHLLLYLKYPEDTRLIA